MRSSSSGEIVRVNSLATRQDPLKPNSTFIREGFDAAVIGSDVDTGVFDRDGRAFGYRNLIICDGSILPANPGVNPSLTITALAEQLMSRVPSKAVSAEGVANPSTASGRPALAA